MFALLVLASWLAPAPPGVPVALALYAGRPIAGTHVGLFAWSEATGWERLQSGEVRDLAVGADALWIASARGLHVWRSGERVRPLALGAGARVRGVDAGVSDEVRVATEVGLFRGARVFTRALRLPPGEVHAVRRLGDTDWLARRAALWRLGPTGATPLLRGLSDGWWELRAAARHAGADWLVVPRGLWRVDGERASRVEAPGLGELRDGLARAGVLWLASSRGVYALRTPGADEPVVARLAASAWALAADAERVLVLTDRGLAALDLEGPQASAPGTRFFKTQSRLDVRRLQRAVLAHQGLDAAHLEEVERRARRRAWLPQLHAGLTWDRQRGRDRDYDEVFSAGEVRRLLDRAHDRDRGLRVDVELIWDLSESRSPDDALAVSRERRQVVELRDQVLERVNRLFFERERVRARLSEAPSPDSGALAELQLRERELSAQLDAWSGGLASRLESESTR
jgi:hypothetical protein